MNKEKVIFAMDPGDKGFIAVWDGKEHSFFPMPTKKVDSGEKTKTGKIKYNWEFDMDGLRDLMIGLRIKYKDREKVAFIEDVHAIFGSSAESTFNFGRILGVQQMAFTLLSCPVIKVTPKRWQSVMWKGFQVIKKKSESGKTMVNDTKATSTLVAKTLFPHIDFRKNDRCRTDDDNKVDALLINEYGRRMYEQSHN